MYNPDVCSLSKLTGASDTGEIPDPVAVLHRLEQLLSDHPEGLSEFDLLKALAQTWSWFDPSFRSLQLYQTHFVLFHLLYHWRQNLMMRGLGQLQISPLNICLSFPVDVTEHPQQSVADHDPLASYYLDWQNFELTGQQQVDEMLQNVWPKLLRQSDRQQALEVLGLDEEASVSEIKSCYRKLAQQHHPDRGGDTAVFQRICSAYQSLV